MTQTDREVEAGSVAEPRAEMPLPTDPKTIVGPVISAAHRERVESYIRSGPAEGAELVVGGDRPPIDKGFYVAPTLLAGCTNQMTAAREEILLQIMDLAKQLGIDFAFPTRTLVIETPQADAPGARPGNSVCVGGRRRRLWQGAGLSEAIGRRERDFRRRRASHPTGLA